MGHSPGCLRAGTLKNPPGWGPAGIIAVTYAVRVWVNSQVTVMGNRGNRMSMTVGVQQWNLGDPFSEKKPVSCSTTIRKEIV